MEREDLLRIVAVLAGRSGSGVCRVSAEQLGKAPIAQLHFEKDRNGDIWIDFGGVVIYDDVDTDLEDE